RQQRDAGWHDVAGPDLAAEPRHLLDDDDAVARRGHRELRDRRLGGVDRAPGLVELDLLDPLLERLLLALAGEIARGLVDGDLGALDRELALLRLAPGEQIRRHGRARPGLVER